MSGLMEVLNDIVAERQSQDKQWGGPQHDDTLSDVLWVVILRRQLNLLADAVPDRRQRLIKIAAVAVAAAEAVDRRMDREES